MTRRALLAKLDARKVEEAIAAAERAAAIELRVSVAGLFWGDPQRVAERAFRRLAMTATTRRNGILLLLVPWRRRVVLLADQGITARVDATIWHSAVATVTAAFASGQFSDGLCGAIEALGRALAPHLPPGEKVNELPDAIDRGGQSPRRQ